MMKTFETTVQVDTERRLLRVYLPFIARLVQGKIGVRTEYFHNMKNQGNIRLEFDEDDAVVSVELKGFKYQVGHE